MGLPCTLEDLNALDYIYLTRKKWPARTIQFNLTSLSVAAIISETKYALALISSLERE